MKRSIFLLTLAISTLVLFSARAQSGGNPNLTGAMIKLFGDNQAFSANLEFQISDTGTSNETMNTMRLPGKIKLDTGKSRFDMNMSDMRGGALPPDAAAQFKAMGMDALTAISRPDFKSAYLIYPGIQSYVVNPAPEDASTNLNDYKMDVTRLGKETVDGHDCVKNKVLVTEKNGSQHQSTVWNATDMKNFPVKIETGMDNQKIVMLFTAVSFAKPDAAFFEVPAGFTKYDSMQSLMQAIVMKHMGSQGGGPPH